MELGGIVLSLSDSKGAIYAEEGLTADEVYAVQGLKAKRQALDSYQTKHKYFAGKRPWTLTDKVDIARTPSPLHLL